MQWELLVGLLAIAITVLFGLTNISRTILTKADLLAGLFAFSKSASLGREITLNDLTSGYDTAEKILGKKRPKMTKIVPVGRCLIFGAGDGGKVLAARMLKKCIYNNIDFGAAVPIGFIDENQALWGTEIGLTEKRAKLPVFGGVDALGETIRSNSIEAVVVAVGNPEKTLLLRVNQICKEEKTEYHEFHLYFTTQ